jgi:ribosomal protein L32
MNFSFIEHTTSPIVKLTHIMFLYVTKYYDLKLENLLSEKLSSPEKIVPHCKCKSCVHYIGTIITENNYL